MRYWLGNPSADPPAGSIAFLPLAGSVSGKNLYVTDDLTVLPVRYTELLPTGLEDDKEDRTIGVVLAALWETTFSLPLATVSPTLTIRDLCLLTLTDWSDPLGETTAPTYIPTTGGSVGIFLGRNYNSGNAIAGRKFDKIGDHWAKLKLRMQAACRHRHNTGQELPKWLGHFARRFGDTRRFDDEVWRDFVPDDIRGEVPPPQRRGTSVTEAFTGTNGDPIANFTVSDGAWEIQSNKAQTNEGGVNLAYHDTALAADHYAQAVVEPGDAGGGGVAVRIDASGGSGSEDYFRDTWFTSTQIRCQRYTGGSPSTIGTDGDPGGSATQIWIRLIADGSQIVRYWISDDATSDQGSAGSGFADMLYWEQITDTAHGDHTDHGIASTGDNDIVDTYTGSDEPVGFEIVQTVGGTPSDPGAATLVISPIVGNRIFSLASERSGTGHAAMGVTWSGTNSFTKHRGHDQELGDSNARHSISLWSVVVSAGDPKVIHADDGTSNSKLETLVEVRYFLFDFNEEATASDDTGTGTTSPVSTGTTASVGDDFLLVIAFFGGRTGTDDVTAVSYTNNLGDDGQEDNLITTNNSLVHSLAFLMTETGGTFSSSVSWTGGSGMEAAAGIVVFSNGDAAPAGTTRRYSLPLLGVG